MYFDLNEIDNYTFFNQPGLLMNDEDICSLFCTYCPTPTQRYLYRILIQYIIVHLIAKKNNP